MRNPLAVVVTGALMFAPQYASAQKVMVDAHVGHAAFLDDSAIEHSVVGVGTRVFVGSRVAIGPELTYMRGPGKDRDLLFMATTSVDLMQWGPGQRAVPYLAVGLGLMRHTSGFAAVTSTKTGPVFELGVGARIAVGPRWFVAPELRAGIEAHWRIGVSVGFVR